MLFARAAQPDLQGRVQFLGWRDDVPARLRDAAVHCLPSRPEMCEGLPLSVVEAKEAGVPTVAFDHGPFPELIDHTRTGWLCRERTPAALAEGLEWFLAAPDRRGSHAHEIRASAARFSREAFAAGWWSVLAGGEVRAGAREPAPVAPAAHASTPRDS
jgi:glycosyltransferase involved in cell wall biosynthesis